MKQNQRQLNLRVGTPGIAKKKFRTWFATLHRSACMCPRRDRGVGSTPMICDMCNSICLHLLLKFISSKVTYHFGCTTGSLNSIMNAICNRGLLLSTVHPLQCTVTVFLGILYPPITMYFYCISWHFVLCTHPLNDRTATIRHFCVLPTQLMSFQCIAVICCTTHPINVNLLYCRKLLYPPN